jgi:hypothetical protein
MAMMRRQSVQRSAVFCIAITSFLVFPEAAISQGTIDFALVIGPDAAVSIRNLTDQERLVTGYSLAAPNEVISTDQWDSIFNKYTIDPDAITSVFGHFIDHSVNGSGFHSSGQVTQYNEFVTLQWPARFTWPIGKPLGNDVEAIRSAAEEGEIYWFADYCELCADDLPIIFEIPEPATIALLLCGLPALFLFAVLRWRRRLQAA